MTRKEKIITRLLEGSRVSHSEVRSILGQVGYRLKRQKGSHEQWVREGRTFTLPCHGKEVPHYILDALKIVLEE